MVADGLYIFGARSSAFAVMMEISQFTSGVPQLMLQITLGDFLPTSKGTQHLT